MNNTWKCAGHQRQSLCCPKTQNVPWRSSTWRHWRTPSIYTPNSKMAVLRIDLGRAASKRGIEGRWQDHFVFTYGNPSSETQGRSVGTGEKTRRKFSSTGGKAPGYWLSPDHFQTVKRMLVLDWAQKMLCIIVPNRRTVSPEFFSWVRTRRLLSRHSCPVRSPSFPNQKRRNYRSVEKRFGCYQQEQFNLHRENSVSDGSQCIVNNKKFKMKRRRESEKKQ